MLTGFKAKEEAETTLGRLFSLLTLTATCFSGQQKPRELTSLGGYQRST